MTIALDLKPEEAAILNDYAQTTGTDVQTVLHELVAHLPSSLLSKPLRSEPQNKTVLLMQEWLAEKNMLTGTELDQNDRDFEDFKNSINSQ